MELMPRHSAVRAMEATFPLRPFSTTTATPAWRFLSASRSRSRVGASLPGRCLAKATSRASIGAAASSAAPAAAASAARPSPHPPRALRRCAHPTGFSVRAELLRQRLLTTTACSVSLKVRLSSSTSESASSSPCALLTPPTSRHSSVGPPPASSSPPCVACSSPHTRTSPAASHASATPNAARPPCSAVARSTIDRLTSTPATKPPRPWTASARRAVDVPTWQPISRTRWRPGWRSSQLRAAARYSLTPTAGITLGSHARGTGPSSAANASGSTSCRSTLATLLDLSRTHRRPGSTRLSCRASESAVSMRSLPSSELTSMASTSMARALTAERRASVSHGSTSARWTRDGSRPAAAGVAWQR
mmetsp:Transcript_23921/g.78199  ORF Transcript_23921/g.78199 Transcript_23921/m.78199 type:complete len:363 (-) Transcript_23921:289-1377(-)